MSSPGVPADARSLRRVPFLYESTPRYRRRFRGPTLRVGPEGGPPSRLGVEVDEAGTPILGSSNFHNIDNSQLGFEFGWARIDFSGWEYDLNGDGEIANVPGSQEIWERSDLGGLTGLPVTGFAVQKFENGFLEGNTLANYGGIFQHKATRNLVQVSAP